MKITISIPDEVCKELDEFRIEKYPHLKKVSRMMLQVMMDKLYDHKKEK